MKEAIKNGQVTYIGFDKKNNNKWLVETRGSWTYVDFQENEFTQVIFGYVVRQENGTYKAFQSGDRNVKFFNDVNDGIEYIKSLKINKYSILIEWFIGTITYESWKFLITSDDSKEYVEDVIRNCQKNSDIEFDSPDELLDSICNEYGWKYETIRDEYGCKQNSDYNICIKLYPLIYT